MNKVSVSPKKILNMIVKQAKKNDYMITRQAEQNMIDEGLIFEDVEDIVFNPKWLIKEDMTTKGEISYKIKGKSLHKAVVTIDGGIVVVIAVMNKDS